MKILENMGFSIASLNHGRTKPRDVRSVCCQNSSGYIFFFKSNIQTFIMWCNLKGLLAKFRGGLRTYVPLYHSMCSCGLLNCLLAVPSPSNTSLQRFPPPNGIWKLHLKKEQTNCKDASCFSNTAPWFPSP